MGDDGRAHDRPHDRAPGRTTWLVRDAVTAMERGDTDVLAVVDYDDRFVGMVTTDEVLRLDEILERTGMA